MKRARILIATALAVFAAFSILNNRAEPTVTSEKQQREPNVLTKPNVLTEPNVLKLPADAPQLAYLKITPVTEDIIPALEPLHGRIAYDDDVTARVTSPIAGRVIAIHAHLGDNVKAGQTLVALDAPDFAQARADLRKAESDLQLKSKAFKRAKLLFDGEVIAEKDYDAAEDDLRQARAESERAALRLHNLGGDHSRNYELRSPIAGIVTERRVNVGSEVAADVTAPLFVVTDSMRLWLDIEVAEKDLNKIVLGQRFRVESDAYPNVAFEANAVFIGKVLDPQTRRVTVHCALRDDSERLKPEMYVRATPLGGAVLRPRVPNAALISEGIKTFLFVEQAPGVLQKREVVLAYRGHEESYVESGLHAGEHVVVSGALLLNAEMQGD